MIERVSELPLFGPEEQLRKFINQVDQPDETGKLYDSIGNEISAVELTQRRVAKIDEMLQNQLIWSVGVPSVDDAYFYWDWCPSGNEPTKWNIVDGDEFTDNLVRDIDRTFDYTKFKGYQNSRTLDEMPRAYNAEEDAHTTQSSDELLEEIDKHSLLHNIMRSYIEVSEWLGDGATQYGSHNGFVSRKMSLCWLFDAIRALINFKLVNQDKYAQEDIYPLDGTYDKDTNPTGHMERFLAENERSERNLDYEDYLALDQMSGACGVQSRVRATNPNLNGTLKVRGNEWHYGERGYFYTHNSFMGECRFFHNTRFLGQATFDKEINGTAMRSRWADLAEYKESDSSYEPGTLVMFGGDKEITLTNGKECHAIVTTRPGLMLNGDEQEGKTMVGIALVGTVPVKVVGVVRKFDRLVADSKNLGSARTRKWYEFWKKPIGISMGCNKNGMVDCITRLEF